LTALAGVVLGEVVSTSGGEMQCRSSACTYVAADGKTSIGKCGSRKSDDKHCYCTEVIEKKPGDQGGKQAEGRFQVQTGCEK